MKIARVEAIHCDGGWRPWTFVRVETDDGLVGWGECSDNRSPYAIAGAVRDLTPLLIGQDPRPVERLYWDMLRATRQNLGGVTHKAMAGIELALWDIKARALGVPVYELFGGPLRDRMRLYWSHCGTTRARLGHVLGTPPLRSYDDIAALGKEVVARGFTALKTNMVIPGDPATVYFPGFASGINSTDGAPTVEILDAIERLIGTFRAAVGPKVGLCLDLNYNFRTEGVLRIAKLLEPFDMQWLEYDNWDPQALLQIKQSTSTRLASLESLVTTRQFRPFLELHAVDVAIIDVPWNGFSQAVQIGRMAEAYEINIAPHNYYSHLADLHSLHLCAVLPNVRIMEIDIDDVAWKADLVTRPPVIKDGHIFLPEGPGWGAEINEEVLRAHPWPGVGERARSFYGMSPEQMRARPATS
ncbi:MAG TPA: mandelate racemase/muconate lactonizing enzyme family protein [Methylomirabilota bacterium]|nr:mandelate racemase/muconate lactonizing enzyme family protein [Methylomirabilota bacterium]